MWHVRPLLLTSPVGCRPGLSCWPREATRSTLNIGPWDRSPLSRSSCGAGCHKGRRRGEPALHCPAEHSSTAPKPISGQRTTAETTHSIKTCSSGTVARRRFFSLPAAAGTDPVEHVRIQQTEYTRSGCVRGSPEFAPRGRSHQRVPRLQLGHRLVLFRRLIEPVPPVCEPTSHSRLAAQLGIYATAYSASHRPPPQQHMQSVDTSRHSYRPLSLCLRSQMMLHSVRPSSGSAPWHYAAG